MRPPDRQTAEEERTENIRFRRDLRLALVIVLVVQGGVVRPQNGGLFKSRFAV